MSRDNTICAIWLVITVCLRPALERITFCGMMSCIQVRRRMRLLRRSLSRLLRGRARMRPIGRGSGAWCVGPGTGWIYIKKMGLKLLIFQKLSLSSGVVAVDGKNIMKAVIFRNIHLFQILRQPAHSSPTDWPHPSPYTKYQDLTIAYCIIWLDINSRALPFFVSNPVHTLFHVPGFPFPSHLTTALPVPTSPHNGPILSPVDHGCQLQVTRCNVVHI